MISTAEAERGRTWMITIVEAIRGDVKWESAGPERKTGALSINIERGEWYDFAAAKGGIYALPLVKHLKGDCSLPEAWQWLAAFLANHPGTGACAGGAAEDEDDGTPASRILAEETLTHLVPVEGTPAATYLASRNISGPYPDLLGFLENARLGEHALVARLTAHDRVVGVQVTYLDPEGRKSTVLPARRRFNLEKAPGVVFLVPPPDDLTGAIDMAADVIFAEGVEDTLSLRQLRRSAPIYGLPSIGALRVQDGLGSKRVRVCRDGDAPDSASEQALTRGLDHLLLQGAKVTVTAPLVGEDNNSVLQKGGTDEVLHLFNNVTSPSLSVAAQLVIDAQRLAGLDKTAYSLERRKVAATLKIPVGILDAEVAKHRPKPTEEPEAKEVAGFSIPEDEPWTGPLPPLAAILDTIYVTLRRYVVMSEHQATAVTLWCAAAHLVNSTQITLDKFPKLAIQSKDPVSGKTTLLTLVWNVLPRAKLWTYPSGAFLVRAIEQGSPSLCLDELQYAEDRNLLRVINAAHDRRLAFVPLLVPNKSGAYEPREFQVWVPMALARLGEFRPAQQTRSIVIWMLPKTITEECERLRRVAVPELADCRRQFAAWADTITTWSPPPIPKILENRHGDNWEPLLGVAKLAGPEWLKRARAAAQALMRTEQLPSLIVRLLRSLWLIYQPDPTKDATRFMATSDVIAELLQDPDEDWSTAGPGGQAITPEWLRERLAHLLNPPGSTREVHGGPRGYAFRQFKDSFARYVGQHPSSDDDIIDSTVYTQDHPVHPAPAADNPSKTAVQAEPGAEPGDPPASAYRENPADPPLLPQNEPGEPGKSGEPIYTSNTVKPNSEDHPDPPVRNSRPKRTSQIVEAIKATAAAHPDWSDARIGKHCGRTASVVRRILEAEVPAS